jgi:hypothetical protein
MNHPEDISAIELKRLLHELKDKRPDIGLRFRLTGQLWASNFCRIEKITDNEVVVIDNSRQRYLNRFWDIIQFEIDSPFQAYRPFYHYKINPLKEQKFA